MDVLIVESAAKARTLQKYLGNGWAVVATGGHVETLPNDRKVHGKDASKAYWANRPGELPDPNWVWTDRGEEAVKTILEKAGDHPTFWIATDPDREGEFIAWSLERRLEGRGEIHRVTFQEVTEEAVRAAIEAPREVDRPTVESALVRKFLDRLVGFRTSKMANGIVPGRGNSMGRVQTPTLGFVVERELEREAHVPIPYFEVRARAEGVDFSARFHETDDPDAWRDASDKVHPTRTFDRELAEQAVAALTEAGRVTIADVRESTNRRRSSAPFSTDALLQAAGSRFSWAPRNTSRLASMLYEAGHITYIRTDSTRLADSALDQVRTVVREEWGEDHLGSGGGKNVATGPVQDAHEAIRPTRIAVEEAPVDDADARRLYRLIRAHTLASQMAPSVTATRSLRATAEGFDRPLTGSVSWRTFDGWEAAYSEFLAPRPTQAPDLPLEVGAEWVLDPAEEESPNPQFVEDETRPPARYRAHTLIRAMKEAGIGRPSTYARTVEKLEERKYVETEEGALAPTEAGRAIWMRAAPLYASDRDTDGDGAGIELFSPEFTARMEERLDELASGDLGGAETWERWRDLIRDLHEAARDRKKSGTSTLQQQDMLTRLLANAPEPRPIEPEAVADLTWSEAFELTNTLRESGILPAPTERQVGYIERLLGDLDLDDEELASIIGTSGVEGIRTTAAASEVIDELQRIHDERRPPSAKQRRYIESLIEKSDLTEAEALALVDARELDDLTGGREGSASALIDQLTARSAEAAEAGET
ncbi:type IA DNA topoisomerase [Gaopeijia maritima]|uniref:DNA topoisomerase n=1 Tax=Gaopeijia maritima TaxID=3119007 RepID=A0ABU9E6K0_9BACT